MTKLSSRTAAIAPSTASTMNFRTNRGISSPLSRQVDIEPRLVERELDRMAGAGGEARDVGAESSDARRVLRGWGHARDRDPQRDGRWGRGRRAERPPIGAD